MAYRVHVFNNACKRFEEAGKVDESVFQCAAVTCEKHLLAPLHEFVEHKRDVIV